jgi:hypothetical protein
MCGLCQIHANIACAFDPAQFGLDQPRAVLFAFMVALFVAGIARIYSVSFFAQIRHSPGN